MKTSFYKKWLSFFSIFALLFTQMWFLLNVSAITTLKPSLYILPPVSPSVVEYKALPPAFNPQVIQTSNVWNFLVNQNFISNKEILELSSITSSNAGKVMRTWSVNSSFNKNFIIRPTWTDYKFLVMKLDKKGLDEMLEKTNSAKNIYNQYRGVSWWIWQLEVDVPEMQRLPDRLVLKSKTRIKFNTTEEFNNIKKYYKFDQATIYQALSDKFKNWIKISGKINLENNWVVAWEWSAASTFNSDDLFRAFYNKCMKKTSCVNELASRMWKDTSYFIITNWFRRPTIRTYSSTFAKYLEAMIIEDWWESVIEQEEEIQISLLPVDPLSQANFNNNLRLDPKLVRVSWTKIGNIFRNIEKISKIWAALEEVDETSPADKVRQICNNYDGSEKVACLKLAENYISPKTKKYEKILINGITLGNEYSYNFHRYWKKSFWWFGSVMIYDVDVTLSFWYGFGIRIPIKAEIEINKDIIPVAADLDAKKFKATLKVKTIDATAQQYRDAGIDSTQIFDGQEFVFKVYAYLDWKLVLVDNTIFDRRYDLIEMLGDLLGIDWLHSFDKSKNFTPPYNGENTISLFEKEYGIKIYKKDYELWGGTLYADLLFKAYIDGYITAYCKAVNAYWSSCNKKMYFGKSASQILWNEIWISWDANKIIELTARKTNNQEENLLWEYNEYGIILKDFKYIPQLVAAIKSRARLNYWYDIKVRDGDGDVSTPRYEVYRFTIDLAELGAHVWYGAGGTYTLTEEQKQITALDQKLYSKLKKTFVENLVIFIPQYSWLNAAIYTVGNSIWDRRFEIVGDDDEWIWWDDDAVVGDDDEWMWWDDDAIDWWEEEYPWVEWSPTDDEDYYPWVEWRPSEDERIPATIIVDDRGGYINGKWLYPEDIELRELSRSNLISVKKLIKRVSRAKRARVYGKIIVMLDKYDRKTRLRSNERKVRNILRDLRDIMVAYRLR